MFGRVVIVVLVAVLVWAVLARDTGASGTPQANHLASATIAPGQHLLVP